VIKDFVRLTKRIVNFPEKSPPEKFASYISRWIRLFPGIPAPVRLPNGQWWLLDTDFIGHSLIEGGYETAECDFVARFLKPGMTVVDVGAHRGFYTLLFSKWVGRQGRVLSFEPSPRELRRLKLHLKINFCRNVQVEGCALGEEDSSAANLYVVRENSVLNSLRPPDTVFSASPTPVAVRRLDDMLSQAQLENVDFVKLDVEGGELSVLRGAEQLLKKVPRPVILCEVLEQLTRAWGYPARLVVEHLFQRGFVWFGLDAGSELVPIAREQSEFHGNFIAVPKESLQAVTHLCVPTNSPRAGSLLWKKELAARTR
jgi:FkbM family methyltransferase